MQGRRSRDRYFLLKPPPLRIVAAFHDGLRSRVFKTHRAVFRVVGDCPRSRGSLNQSRIPVGVVSRNKREKRYGSSVRFDF